MADDKTFERTRAPAGDADPAPSAAHGPRFGPIGETARGGRRLLTRPFEEMERLYEALFPSGWFKPFQREGSVWEKMRPYLMPRLPAVDIMDREQEIVVRAELPGVSKEDLSIQVGDNTLTVRGRTRSYDEDRHEDYVCREMTHGEFYRTLSLMSDVDSTATRAAFKDGILEVRLPKRESGKRRSVEIKVE
jgi:HSP20 family protein